MGADRELTADPQVHHQVLLEWGGGGGEGVLGVENIAVLRELAPPPGPGGGSASCYLFSFSSRRKLCSCCILVDNLGETAGGGGGQRTALPGVPGEVNAALRSYFHCSRRIALSLIASNQMAWLRATPVQRPYLPKPLSKATISCRVSWNPLEGVCSGRFWISFSEKRIFRAVPRPWVCTQHTQREAPSDQTASTVLTGAHSRVCDQQETAGGDNLFDTLTSLPSAVTLRCDMQMPDRK